MSQYMTGFPLPVTLLLDYKETCSRCCVCKELQCHSHHRPLHPSRRTHTHTQIVKRLLWTPLFMCERVVPPLSQFCDLYHSKCVQKQLYSGTKHPYNQASSHPFRFVRRYVYVTVVVRIHGCFLWMLLIDTHFTRCQHTDTSPSSFRYCLTNLSWEFCLHRFGTSGDSDLTSL